MFRVQYVAGKSRHIHQHDDDVLYSESFAKLAESKGDKYNVISEKQSDGTSKLALTSPSGDKVDPEDAEIKKDILNSVCLRTDGIGQGYSLSLPWPSYRPDVAQVQLQVRYEPRKGLPVLTQNTVALSGGLSFL